MKVDSSIKYNPSIESDASDLQILVVGGTGGLGRAIAQRLAKLGASTTVLGRTFRDETHDPKINFIQADLSSIADTRKVASELNTYDMIVMTTGIFAGTKRQETAEGLEKDIAVSYLNRLAILDTILPNYKKTETKPRVFIMGFPGNDQLGDYKDLNLDKSYSLIKVHMNTVAGNEALVHYFANSQQSVNFYGLNPGLAKTNIRDNLLGGGSWKSWMVESVLGWFTKTPEQYADKIVPTMLSKDLNNMNGTLFNEKGAVLFPSKGFTEEHATLFVELSRELIDSKVPSK